MTSSSATRPRLAAAQTAAALCLDLKANDVVILDLEGVSDMTDCFVIASGSSDTHVRAIAEHVAEEMKKRGIAPHHVEGLNQGRWALVDFTAESAGFRLVHVEHRACWRFRLALLPSPVGRGRREMRSISDG